MLTRQNRPLGHSCGHLARLPPHEGAPAAAGTIASTSKPSRRRGERRDAPRCLVACGVTDLPASSASAAAAGGLVAFPAAPVVAPPAGAPTLLVRATTAGSETAPAATKAHAVAP